MPTNDASFPSIPQAAFLLLGNVLLQYVIVLAFHDFRQVLDLSPAQMHALTTLLANGILLVIVLEIRRATFRDLLHPSPSSPRITFVLLVPPVLMLVPALLLMDQVLMDVLHRIVELSAWEERAFREMVDGNLAAVVAVCILAPVLEEMVFRGVLLRAFLERYPRGQAIGASALFFGVAHFNIYQFVLAFLLGLLLGWLFERSRSLVPCIALHAAMNSAVVVASLRGGPDARVAEATAFEWGAAIAVAALGALLLRRLLADRRG